MSVSDDRVQLAWVETVDGRVHVSTYRDTPAPARKRLTAVCPVCRTPVSLKLGNRKAHHAAHAANSDCVLRDPESALHFNVKCALADALAEAMRSGAPIRVIERCVAGHPDASRDDAVARALAAEQLPHERLSESCDGRQERVWLSRWTRVELEQRLGNGVVNRVPDLVLYDDHRVVGAIEVFHKHRVDDAKAAALAELGVSWLELRADPVLLLPETAWKPDQPLPAYRIAPARAWRCRRHAEAAATWLEEQRHTSILRAARIVDYMYPTGEHARRVYWLVERRYDGASISLDLRLGDEVLLAERYTREMSDEERCDARSRLSAKLDDHRRWSERELNALSDSPMPWATGRLARAIREAMRQAGPGALECTHPRRYRFAPRGPEWFMPKNREGVTWEREPTDTLENAHPSWIASEAERRQQTDSWLKRRKALREQGDGAGGQGRSGQSSDGRDHAAPARDETHATPAAQPRRPERAELATAAAWGTRAPRPLSHPDLGASVWRLHQHRAATLVELHRRDGMDSSSWIGIPHPGADSSDIRDLDARLAAVGRDRAWISRGEEWGRDLAGSVPWLEVRIVNGVLAVNVRGAVLTLGELAAALTSDTVEFTPHRLAALRQAERLAD